MNHLKTYKMSRAKYEIFRKLPSGVWCKTAERNDREGVRQVILQLETVGFKYHNVNEAKERTISVRNNERREQRAKERAEKLQNA